MIVWNIRVRTHFWIVLHILSGLRISLTSSAGSVYLSFHRTNTSDPSESLAAILLGVPVFLLIVAVNVHKCRHPPQYAIWDFIKLQCYFVVDSSTLVCAGRNAGHLRINF